MSDHEPESENVENYQFAVLAETKSYSKPLVITHLSFGRLVDDVILPYDSDEPFFIDGIPVIRSEIIRMKIIWQTDGFERNFSDLHRHLRHGDLARQKLYADQYATRLDAILRGNGNDVTSQVIKAFDKTIKPSIKDYLPKRKELISAALALFVEGIRALGE